MPKQYTAIKKSCLKQGKSKEEAERIAAATYNKNRPEGSLPVGNKAAQKAGSAIKDTKGNKMKKEQANKLLETIKQLQEAMSVPGDEWDDEGNYIGGSGGYKPKPYYAYRKPFNKPTTPVTNPITTPGATVNPDEKIQKATRIANSIAKKKGQVSADQGLINWVMKQIDAGKFTENQSIVNEVKSELLETAEKLLQEANKKLKETSFSDKRGFKKGRSDLNKFKKKGHKPKTAEEIKAQRERIYGPDKERKEREAKIEETEKELSIGDKEDAAWWDKQRKKRGRDPQPGDRDPEDDGTED